MDFALNNHNLNRDEDNESDGSGNVHLILEPFDNK